MIDRVREEVVGRRQEVCKRGGAVEFQDQSYDGKGEEGGLAVRESEKDW